MSIKPFIANKTKEKTAAYGCMVIINKITKTAPKIKEAAVLLFTHIGALHFCSARVATPTKTITLTATKYTILT